MAYNKSLQCPLLMLQYLNWKSSSSTAKNLKRHNFKVTFAPIYKFSLFRLKTTIGAINLSYLVIYCISCQCGLSYTGQTKHKLDFHLCEHKLNIWHQETNKSTTVKHCQDIDRTFNFDSGKIACKLNFIFELDFFETFHIHKNHNNVGNCNFAIHPFSHW